jgi:hypothetical protein
MLNEVVTVPISKMFILVHVKLIELQNNCLNLITVPFSALPPPPPPHANDRYRYCKTNKFPYYTV